MPRSAPSAPRPAPAPPPDPGADRRRRVLVLSAAIGAGHDGAARELARRLERRGVETEIRDWTFAIPRWGRWLLRDLYAPSVHHAPRLFDWIFTSLERRGLVRSMTLHLVRRSEDRVLGWARDADAVVATYPLAGQALGRLRAGGRLRAPALAFLTDPAAHDMWCHSGLDAHLTVAPETAADARRYGVEAWAVGALCAPRFARPVPRTTRPRLRAELGIPDAAPTALLTSGSLGMGSVEEAVAAIGTHPDAWALVACGRNEGLRARLAGRPRTVALGWRDDMPELMAASDLLIHNAGGLSCTEAGVAGLPVVTFRPIPGHGRANAAVLDAAGTAPWPRDAIALVAAIEAAVGPAPRRARSRRGATAWWIEDADASAVVALHAGASPDRVVGATGPGATAGNDRAGSPAAAALRRPTTAVAG